VLVAGNPRGDLDGWYAKSIPLARDRGMTLAEARSPEPRRDRESRPVLYDKEAFLREFFPGHAADVAAGAAALVARHRVRGLAEMRRRVGLTRAQVAERMDLAPERISDIEARRAGTTDVGTLAAFVEALGGQLEVIADFGAERAVLRCPATVAAARWPA
jgi:Helix-turn-helix domain